LSPDDDGRIVYDRTQNVPIDDLVLRVLRHASVMQECDGGGEDNAEDQTDDHAQ
jgi:hypothetical protein